GQPWRTAFPASFDVSLEQLEQEVESHRDRIASGSSVLMLTLPEPASDPEVRPVPAPEAAAGLAELGLSVGQLALARSLADGALGERREAAQLRALAAICAAREQDFERARSEIEFALRSAPDDARVQEALGDTWAMRARSERDASLLAPAREAYAR